MRTLRYICLSITLIFNIMTTTAENTSVFTLPTLPYALNALEPYISEETMNYHYGKHHQTYINNLNQLIKETPFEHRSLEEIVTTSEGSIFNNAAQAWNHTFYFMQFSPKPQNAPTGALLEAINKTFVSVDNLKTEITRAAAALFGSGWVWLVADKHGKLAIMPMSNAGNPLVHGMRPILTVDVWEHAYYVDYRNRRADAVNALWNIIDWHVAEERFM